MSARTLAERGFALLAKGAVAEALPILARAAREGDARAQLELGLQAIWGEHGPRDLDKGYRLVKSAAERGLAEARLQRAALLATGLGTAPDWAAAVALLRKAGSEADPTLALLDAMALTPDGGPSEPIPAPDRLSERPDVLLFRHLLTPDECAWLIRKGEPFVVPSRVLDPATGLTIDHPVRRSDGGSFAPPNEDPVVRALNRRLAAASETDVRAGEPLHILRYRPGQEYRPHFDVLPGEANQRELTLLVYLNDGYEGGATAFPDGGPTIRGEVGDVLMFRNVMPDGTGDRSSRHAGLPVTRGTKWLATRWIRARPYHPWGLQIAAP